MSFFGAVRTKRVALTAIAAWLGTLAVACAIFVGAPLPAGALDTNTTPTQPVIFIGFSGLRWDDISAEQTPNFARFTEEAAGANLVVRTVGDTTCPAQGWLTLGTGRRTREPSVNCTPLAAPEGGIIPQWETIVAANKSNSYAPRAGTLASGVDADSTLAIGRGAALALAQADGSVAGTYIDVAPSGALATSLPSELRAPAGATTAQSAAQAFAQAFTQDTWEQTDKPTSLVIVDLGQIRHSGKPLGADTRTATGTLEAIKASFQAADMSLPAAAREQVAQLDEDFGALLAKIEEAAPHARILVASVADAQNTSGQLQFFAARGLEGTDDLPAFATSTATRQTGLVQLTDLTPTLLDLLGTQAATTVLTSNNLPGAPVTAGAPSASMPARLVDDHLRSQTSRSMVGIVYVGAAALAIAACVWPLASRGRNLDERRRHQMRQLAAFSASLPAASLLANLVPWWRMDNPRLSLLAAIAVIAALIAGVATLRSREREAGWMLLVVGVVSFLTVALDVVIDPLTSSYPLQRSSILGSQPQIGGRFYGMSNPPFAVFATGLVLILAVSATRLRRAGRVSEAGRLILGLGIAAVLIDGFFIFGVDFGGPPALVIGLGLMFMAVTGRKLTLGRIAAIAASALATMMVFPLLDYLRPASQRSHLGKFVSTIREGGVGHVLSRKVSAIFFGLPVPAAFAVLGAIVLLILGLLMAHRRKVSAAARLELKPSSSLKSEDETGLDEVSEMLRLVRLGALGTLITAFLLNDSSIIIPLVGLAIACPACVVERLCLASEASA